MMDMNEKQNSNRSQVNSAPSPQAKPKKTLGLTGITINAMALMAPGAFMWLLYQSQSAGAAGSNSDIWIGVVLALVLAFLTAASLGALARRFPNAGLRSAYHFAESAFRETGNAELSRWYRPAKHITSWAAHLYYWTFPGVMVAFTVGLADYVLGQFGYHPTIFGKIILAVGFAALVGFLALRGITGSTTSSVVLNILQLSAILFFSILAMIFRWVNPIGLSTVDWVHANPVGALLPTGYENVVFQGAIAMFLMLGFEASTALGGVAKNAGRDVPRAAVLTLVVQGAFAYLLEYFAAGLAMNQKIAVSTSGLPIGDLTLQMGDALLYGNGQTVLLIITFTVFIALLASALTSLNNGVRVSFSMSLDNDMPSVLSFLHPQYSTPYVTVVLLGSVSAIIGSISVLGGLSVVLGFILATNMGAFMLYAVLALLTIVSHRGSAGHHWFWHSLLPALGFLANLAMVIAFPIIGFRLGGIAGQATFIAMIIGLFWTLLIVANFFRQR